MYILGTRPLTLAAFAQRNVQRNIYFFNLKAYFGEKGTLQRPGQDILVSPVFLGNGGVIETYLAFEYSFQARCNYKQCIPIACRMMALNSWAGY